MRGKHLITRSIAFYLKLTLIPAFYNLPCSNFRLKRSPTRKRRHAINQQPVTLNMPVSNQCSPIPSRIKLSAIRKSPDVMKCDLVYEKFIRIAKERCTICCKYYIPPVWGKFSPSPLTIVSMVTPFKLIAETISFKNEKVADHVIVT